MRARPEATTKLMDDLWAGLAVLAALLVVSAFFSGSETAVTAVDRYRLADLAYRGNRSARVLLGLLARHDRLLGAILIGNNVVNLAAASLTAVIAVGLGGDAAVAVATAILTFVVLVFAEVLPKSIAASYPERISLLVAWPMWALVRLLSPLVTVVTGIGRVLLAPWRINLRGRTAEVSAEQLVSVVRQSGNIGEDHQRMLLGLLSLSEKTVRDAMVPSNAIQGIDLRDSLPQVLASLRAFPHSRAPVYHRTINDVVGILNLRQIAATLRHEGGDELRASLTKASLENMMAPPVFVPETTPLSRQLADFQERRYEIAIVVDEYGHVEGMVSLRDVLGTLLGSSPGQTAANGAGEPQQLAGGGWLVEGSMPVRELNHELGWNLPEDSARTVGGLVVRHLETLPQGLVSARIDGYRLSVRKMEGDRLSAIEVHPA